jgi:hypothetical protein
MEENSANYCEIAFCRKAGENLCCNLCEKRSNCLDICRNKNAICGQFGENRYTKVGAFERHKKYMNSLKARVKEFRAIIRT